MKKQKKRDIKRVLGLYEHHGSNALTQGAALKGSPFAASQL